MAFPTASTTVSAAADAGSVVTEDPSPSSSRAIASPTAGSAITSQRPSAATPSAVLGSGFSGQVSSQNHSGGTALSAGSAPPRPTGARRSGGTSTQCRVRRHGVVGSGTCGSPCRAVCGGRDVCVALRWVWNVTVSSPSRASVPTVR